MWKRLFRQPLPLPRLSLPLPTEPGLYESLDLISYELADKYEYDYQNQQLTICKGTLLVRISQVLSISRVLLLCSCKKCLQHINTNSIYNNLTSS